jgi:putative aldouronate transport system permease protein
MYGMKHFINFFGSYYFVRVLKNTLVISLSTLVFAFPAPIILALLLNEVKNQRFKKAVQTISYLPHFISLVVACSLVVLFTSHNGFIVDIMRYFGYNSDIDLLNNEKMFVPIYVISDIWQKIGWDSIIYIAALSGIDQEQYEAAKIDGANRFQQMLNVTLPGISSTIILLLILRVGQLMGVGHEKIILLYNDGILETADVISSFVYRRGLIEGNFSFSSAVGLFNSTINFVLVIMANKISQKVSGSGLW